MVKSRHLFVMIALCFSIVLCGAVSQANEKERKEPATSEFIEGAKKVQGLWTLYFKDQKLYADIPASHLGKDFILSTAIARGIGEGWVLGGMSWDTGESIIWTLKQVGDNLHVIRRNVRFKAAPGTPEEDAVKISYSDSVLYSLPVMESTPDRLLVDMSRIFLSDDLGIGKYIGRGFSFARDRSIFTKVKAFPGNVEIEVASVYSGSQHLETISDPSGVQVHVHYSLSLLPEKGYTPRRADDRVGYFMTVLKDYSDDQDPEKFVRLVNRWNLKKKDPAARLSPPEEPIVFYIEKTVPVYLRPYVQAGIEEWNKAFEKLGFSNAIVVLQQSDDADWEPEDIRYNTFRWITADAGFAMAPIRTNPLTGEILDADIIFDAGFLEYWKQDFETMDGKTMAAFTPGDPGLSRGSHRCPGSEHVFFQGLQQQMALAATAMAGDEMSLEDGRLPEEFIFQAIKMTVMHEVGHTLGLRHNFRASAWKSLKEIDAASLKGEPFVASVMDYTPAYIAPSGQNQGDYFQQTLGPYDHWAVEYGYRPIGGQEAAELDRIASRCTEDGLQFATDEDAQQGDPDPLVNTFDLGKDPVVFALRQMMKAQNLLPDVVDRIVGDGEGYQRATQAFGMLLTEYWRAGYFASRVPGGVHVQRAHKGETCNPAPIQVVDAEQQRQAMRLLGETIFTTPDFRPELLTSLAPTFWNHWGIRRASRVDYPIHAVMEKIQGGILIKLLNPVTLSRLLDNELKTGPENRYTLAEHMRMLVETTFKEIKRRPAGVHDSAHPLITSFRRNLQKTALKQMALMITGGAGFPEDSRTLARLHLSELQQEIQGLMQAPNLVLDDYSRAHLLDSLARIRQVLNAGIQLGFIS